jgi:hypothetical protein
MFLLSRQSPGRDARLHCAIGLLIGTFDLYRAHQRWLPLLRSISAPLVPLGEPKNS